MASKKLVPWMRQPQYAAPVNKFHPLANGLLAVIDPAIAPLLNGRSPTSNTGVKGTGPSGQALKYSAAKTTWAFDAALNAGVTSPSGFSVFLLVDVNTLTNFGGLVSIQDTTTTKVACEFRIGTNATDSRLWFARSNAGSLTTWDSGGNRITAGAKQIAICLTLADDQVNTAPIAYVNGVQFVMTQVSGAGQVGAVTVPTTNGLVIGGRSPDTATQLDGSIYRQGFWNRPLSPGEATQITANPWQISAPLVRRRRRLVPAAGGAIVLTGNAATASVGTLVPSESLAASGNTSTASTGALAPVISLALTGNAATAAAGATTAALSLALTGQAATSSAGSVGVGGTTQALTGNAATTAAGTPVAGISLALAGNGATASVGTVAPSESLALSGNSVTASAGTPVAALSFALAGNAATASAGTVAVPGIVVPAGQSATASAGQVAPGLTVALTGNAATTSVGALSKVITLALSGLAGTSAAGIVIPGLSKALTGNQVTASAGSMAIGGNVSLALTGNAAVASAGVLSVAGVLGTSEWWAYDVPVNDMRYAVPANNLRYDVDSENLT